MTLSDYNITFIVVFMQITDCLFKLIVFNSLKQFKALNIITKETFIVNLNDGLIRYTVSEKQVKNWMCDWNRCA